MPFKLFKKLFKLFINEKRNETFLTKVELHSVLNQNKFEYNSNKNILQRFISVYKYYSETKI